MEQLVAQLVAKFPIVAVILAVLGGLVVVAQVVVAMTATKKDDEILQKVESNSIGGAILNLLKSFAPFQKKPDGTIVSSSSAAK